MDDAVTFARRLRREQTPAERRFWTLLHPWRVSGQHWRRQAPIGPYVADFVYKRAKLIVEIDGETHFSEAGVAHDRQRTGYLEGRGYRVLRFSNAEITGNPEGVFAVMVGLLGEPGEGPKITPT